MVAGNAGLPRQKAWRCRAIHPGFVARRVPEGCGRSSIPAAAAPASDRAYSQGLHRQTVCATHRVTPPDVCTRQSRHRVVVVCQSASIRTTAESAPRRVPGKHPRAACVGARRAAGEACMTSVSAASAANSFSSGGDCPARANASTASAPLAWIRPESNSVPAVPRTTPGASTSSTPSNSRAARQRTAPTNGRRNRPASSVQSASIPASAQLPSCHLPRHTAPGMPKAGEPGSAPMHQQ